MYLHRKKSVAKIFSAYELGYEHVNQSSGQVKHPNGLPIYHPRGEKMASSSQRTAARHKVCWAAVDRAEDEIVVHRMASREVEVREVTEHHL